MARAPIAPAMRRHLHDIDTALVAPRVLLMNRIVELVLSLLLVAGWFAVAGELNTSTGAAVAIATPPAAAAVAAQAKAAAAAPAATAAPAAAAAPARATSARKTATTSPTTVVMLPLDGERLCACGDFAGALPGVPLAPRLA
jgi:hypothetical protein